MSKEYIEREALFKKLHNVGGCDADTGTYAAGYDAAIDLAIELLKKAPAADVVEVVRCGECVLWDRTHISCEGLAKCLTGELGIRYRSCKDYCSRGKRKEQEGNR